MIHKQKRTIRLRINVDVEMSESSDGGYHFFVPKYNFHYNSKDRSGWATEYFDDALIEHLKKLL